MTVEEAVRAILLTLAPLTALVANRIYLEKLPQGPEYPCVRVLLVSDPTAYHLRGEQGTRPSRVQVDAFSREGQGQDPYAKAAAVASAIHGDGAGSGLSGYRGDIGDPAVTIGGIFRLERRRYYDPDELRVLTMSQDYRVWSRA